MWAFEPLVGSWRDFFFFLVMGNNTTVACASTSWTATATQSKPEAAIELATFLLRRDNAECHAIKLCLWKLKLWIVVLKLLPRPDSTERLRQSKSVEVAGRNDSMFCGCKNVSAACLVFPTVREGAWVTALPAPLAAVSVDSGLAKLVGIPVLFRESAH